jgi:hypothetical protein
VEEMKNADVLEQARRERPDSEWTVHLVAATSFYINPIRQFPITSDEVFPDYMYIKVQ